MYSYVYRERERPRRDTYPPRARRINYTYYMYKNIYNIYINILYTYTYYLYLYLYDVYIIYMYI